MKRRRAIFLLCLTLLTASCGIMKPRNAAIITDHEEMMAILQEHFPDLYVLHEQERIEVDAIYLYNDRQGRPNYKLSLRYMPPHVH